MSFMKENFEYLINEYGVALAVNLDYATKNSLSSLDLVANHIFQYIHCSSGYLV